MYISGPFPTHSILCFFTFHSTPELGFLSRLLLLTLTTSTLFYTLQPRGPTYSTQYKVLLQSYLSCTTSHRTTVHTYSHGFPHHSTHAESSQLRSRCKKRPDEHQGSFEVCRRNGILLHCVQRAVCGRCRDEQTHWQRWQLREDVSSIPHDVCQARF